MYDCVIIGGGPGGIAAAIYAIRSGLKTIVLEKVGIGGQIAKSDEIENYPGFPHISGMELMSHFEEHAKSLDTEFKYAEISKIESKGDIKILHAGRETIEAKTVIITTGATPKLVGLNNEEALIGRGVSTCATCDGPFNKGREVVVIGGGDTAVKESIYLSKIASKVYHIHRRDRFRAEKILQDRLMARENVEFLWKHTASEILSDDSGVTGVRVKNLESGQERDLNVSTIFIFVGITPNTAFIDCDKDEQGFIKVNDRMETSMHGVYAAGDCRVTPLKQVATAVGDGAIAAFIAEEYVSELEGRAYGKS